MNNKLIIFLVILSASFGYTIYEAIKLDKKLGENTYSKTGSILQVFPEKIDFINNDKTAFNVNEFFDQKKKVFVHFWATWCGPCEVEFPELVEFLSKFKTRNDIVFLLVAVNDDDKKVKKFLKSFNLDFKNVILLKDNTNNFNKFGTYKLPETILFDSSRKVIRKFSGQQPWSQEFLVNFFKKL